MPKSHSIVPIVVADVAVSLFTPLGFVKRSHQIAYLAYP
jgi:hypothetical protein